MLSFYFDSVQYEARRLPLDVHFVAQFVDGTMLATPGWCRFSLSTAGPIRFCGLVLDLYYWRFVLRFSLFRRQTCLGAGMKIKYE